MDGTTTIDFTELSDRISPQISKEYVSNQRLGYGHFRKEYESFVMMKTWWALRLKKCVRETDAEHWLKSLLYL